MDYGQTTDSDDGGKREETGGDEEAAGRMRRAISAASKGTGSREELKASARALVEQLRSENQRPEQMLLQIKKILAESGLRPSYAAAKDSSVAAGAEASVYRDVIAWSIRFYYADRSAVTGNDS
ncbi:MAG: hypothetical protein JWM41_291 [Gemmatimonadetes bacterium]|nr:hypothetical protein [Gemmatimonadota bacterium]